MRYDVFHSAYEAASVMTEGTSEVITSGQDGTISVGDFTLRCW